VPPGGGRDQAGLPVYVSGIQVSGVTYLSDGFLIVPLPTGTQVSDISFNVDPDPGAQQTIDTVPADGRRLADVVLHAAALTEGTNTIVITKLSGEYATLDGFGVVS
jgi:hypothetical protein